jgi:S1-C subfamily serine protease
VREGASIRPHRQAPVDLLLPAPARCLALLPGDWLPWWSKRWLIAGAGFWPQVLGDIIVSIDDQAIQKPEDLLGALDSKKVGERVRVGVLRSEGGGRVEVVVELGDRGAVLGQQQ